MRYTSLQVRVLCHKIYEKTLLRCHIANIKNTSQDIIKQHTKIYVSQAR